MTCEHFAVEGLARQEAGKPDPHVDGCVDCQAARATYQRMTDALGDVGADLYPRAGWEDEVLARVRAERPARRRWWLGAGVGAAVLAAAIAVLVLRPRDRAVSTIDRVQRVEAVRGDGWAAGDSIWAVSEGGRAVWIYRDDHLARTCDLASIDPPHCQRHGAGVRAWVRTNVGTYHVFSFQSPPPPVAPEGFDEAKAIIAKRVGWAKDAAFDVR